MTGEIDETAPLETMSDARAALYVVISDSLEFHRAAIPWKKTLMRQITQEQSSPDSTHFLDKINESVSPPSTQGPLPSPSWDESSPTTTSTTPDRMQHKVDLGTAPTTSLTAELPSSAHVHGLLLRQRGHYESRLQRWNQAMQRIKTKSDDASSSLIMYCRATTILMASRLSLYESIHDDFTHEYEEIVRYAEMYYKSRSEQLSFTFEPGAIPMLWMVAIKCRVPSLRRKALKLIRRAPMKECMWARDSVADFASRIIAIEEGLSSFPEYSGNSEDPVSPPFDDSLPPESGRIHDAEILKDVRSGRSAMRVTRYLDGPHGSRVQSVQYYPI